MTDRENCIVQREGSMEINQVSKMLAYSFVSELLQKNKIKKRNSSRSLLDLDSALPENQGSDTAEMNFGDLEEYYKNVVSVIENTPEIRESLVGAMQNVQKRGEDLNDFYPTQLIADDPSLKKILFIDD